MQTYLEKMDSAKEKELLSAKIDVLSQSSSLQFRSPMNGLFIYVLTIFWWIKPFTQQMKKI